jgi:hypothetical protein
MMGWGWGGMLAFLVFRALYAVYRGREKISCHTGTIDAAWAAVKDFIPNSLCSKSKDVLLYAKCWQCRYVNVHTRLQQKTISTLKRLL